MENSLDNFPPQIIIYVTLRETSMKHLRGFTNCFSVVESAGVVFLAGKSTDG